MKKLEDFLRPTQKQLFKLLAKKFKGKALLSKGNFILVCGTAPVMLVVYFHFNCYVTVLKLVNGANIVKAS